MWPTPSTGKLLGRNWKLALRYMNKRQRVGVRRSCDKFAAIFRRPELIHFADVCLLFLANGAELPVRLRVEMWRSAMDDQITKVEYLRQHARFLSAVARRLKRDDKSRARLLNMSDHLEHSAELAEKENRRFSTRDDSKSRSHPLPRGAAIRTGRRHAR